MPNEEVTFTQYLRPDGRTRPAIITMTEDIANMARSLQADGYELAIEELTNGVISMTVGAKDEQRFENEEGDLAHELCPNGPPVVDAVRKLITEAFNSPRRRRP